MKTKTIMSEKQIIEPHEITIYVAEDGKEFRTEYDAKSYEQKLNFEKKSKEFNSRYQFHQIIEEINLNEEGTVYAAYINRPMDDELKKDFQWKFPYLKSHSFFEDFLVGWNLFVEYEYETNTYGNPWSGYSLHIYSAMDIIKEKEEEIEILKKYI